MENCIRDPRRQHHHRQSLAGTDGRSRFRNAFVTSSRFNDSRGESHWIDRRPKGRKILADFDQKRRHMSERVFYPDTDDVSSTSKVVALSIAVFRFNALTIQRFTWRQPALYEQRIKREAKLALRNGLVRMGRSLGEDGSPSEGRN